MNETSKPLQRCERENPIGMCSVNKNIDRRSKTGKLKKLVYLTKRNVGETRGEKVIRTYSPPFSSSIYKKPSRSVTCLDQGKHQPESGKNIWVKTGTVWKWRLGPLSIDKLPIKVTANPQMFSCRRIIIRSGNLSSTYKFPPQVTVVFPSKVNWRHFAGQLGSSFIREFPHLVQGRNLN